MVAGRLCARERRWSAGVAEETSIVDVNHVFSPLSSGKSEVLLKADQPIFWVFFAHDEKGFFLLSYGELAIYL